MAIETLLARREETHGSFAEVARTCQSLKHVLRQSRNFHDVLNDRQRESLEAISLKMARIASGDPNEPDHWRDIAGYATLVAQALENSDTQ